MLENKSTMESSYFEECVSEQKATSDLFVDIDIKEYHSSDLPVPASNVSSYTQDLQSYKEKKQLSIPNNTQPIEALHITQSIETLTHILSPEEILCLYFQYCLFILLGVTGIMQSFVYFCQLGLYHESTILISSMDTHVVKPLWICSCVLSLFLLLCFPFFYKRHIHFTNARSTIVQSILRNDPFQGSYLTKGKQSTDQIVYLNGTPSPRKKLSNRLLSGFIFLVGLSIYIGISILIQSNISNRSNQTSSLLMSIVWVLFSFIWETLLILTSHMESYDFQSSQTRSILIKTFIFRFSTIVIFLSTRYSYSSLESDCPLEMMAYDILIFTVVNSLSACAIKLFGPVAKRSLLLFLTRYINLDQSIWMPRFSAPHEYVDIITSFFLSYLCMYLILLSPTFCCILLSLQYLVCKYSLLNQYNQQITDVRTDNTYIRYILVIFFVLFVICIFLPPFGFYWIVSGSMLGEVKKNCLFYEA